MPTPDAPHPLDAALIVLLEESVESYDDLYPHERIKIRAALAAAIRARCAALSDDEWLDILGELGPLYFNAEAPARPTLAGQRLAAILTGETE